MYEWLNIDATGMIWLGLQLTFCFATAFFSVINIRWTLVFVRLGYIYSVFYVAGIDEPGMRSVVLNSILLIVVNSYQIIRYHYERNIKILPREHLATYQNLFSLFTPYEFLQIMRYASVAQQQGRIITKGVEQSKLYLLLSGSVIVNIEQMERVVEAPHFLGEMSYIGVKGKRAHADVIATDDSQLMIFTPENIGLLESKIESFHERIHHMIALDLTRKLKTLNASE